MKATMTIDLTSTVNEVIAAYPDTIGVFNSFGVDLCCGGDDTLEEAAKHSEVDRDALLAALYDATSADTNR